MLIHVVSAGETLWQISNYYHVSVESIVEINKLLNPDNIVIGLALVIPTEDIYYIVKPGDSIWRIAQEYGTTVDLILRNNQIANPNAIYPGMVIYIPAIRHRVQPGETLSQIAQRYGVSLQSHRSVPMSVPQAW